LGRGVLPAGRLILGDIPAPLRSPSLAVIILPESGIVNMVLARCFASHRKSVRKVPTLGCRQEADRRCGKAVLVPGLDPSQGHRGQNRNTLPKHNQAAR
jgi:hypothetical protein